MIAYRCFTHTLRSPIRGGAPVRAAWDAWDAWAAWDAWDAKEALIIYYAALAGQIPHAADLLTVGLRDAYSAGLALVVPVESGVLGWAMEARDDDR